MLKFLDEIPGGFFIYRAYGDEEIFYVNSALVKIFGCQSVQEFRELTNNSFRGLVYPDDLDWVEQSISDQIAVNVDDMDSVEYRIRRKDGEIRWVSDFGHLIRNGKLGDIFYVFISDITDEVNIRLQHTKELVSEKEQKIEHLKKQHDKERKLNKQEQLRRLTVIEGLSVNYDTILYVDLESDQIVAYRFCHRTSQLFEGLLIPRPFTGYAEQYVESVVVEEDRENIIGALSPENMRAELARSRTFFVNYRVHDLGGELHLQLRVVNVDDKTPTSKVVIGCLNIEEEFVREQSRAQLLEETLRESKRAENAKAAFLSNMSHDMRTPLNAIMGYAALAKNDASDACRSYLEKIEASGKQLLDMVEKVLAVSQMASGDGKIKSEPCSLTEIVNRAYKTALQKAAAKDISVTADCSQLVHDEVLCDGGKLEQTLNHICGNAVKYTDNGGKVVITAREISQPNKITARYEFEVSDTGKGIDKEYVKRIFDPFVREQDTTASGVFGAGLGLTLSKRYVDLMGGEINVKSEVGKGSVFTVVLHLQPVSVSADDGARDTLNAAGKKILLVDDNEFNLEIEKEMLEEYGFEVDTVKDGVFAVERIEQMPPEEYSVVLMDINMPQMDGYEATRAIRRLQDRKKADLPIIALSANAFESDRQLSLASGMDAHLAKPLDVKQLIATMAKFLR